MPQALVQDPQAVPREELRLGDLVILSRSAIARDERIGGGPIHHAASPSLNAWPARPRHASSRHISPPTSLRALRRVPSYTDVRAGHAVPCPATKRVAALLIETDSIPVIGPSNAVINADRVFDDDLAPRVRGHE